MTRDLKSRALFEPRPWFSVADGFRQPSDDDLLDLVVIEVTRRGIDPEAFGNRIARRASAAGRMLEGRR